MVYTIGVTKRLFHEKGADGWLIMAWPGIVLGLSRDYSQSDSRLYSTSV